MMYRPLIVSFFLSLPFILQGQSTSGDTSRGEFIKIDHFGKLIEDKAGRESIKWISHGLQLRIDSTFIYADSAVIYGEREIYAYGNVVIQQGDSLKVFTDTLYYFRNRDVAELIGEVALEQGTKQLWTEDLTYYLGRRFGEYHRGGVLVDRSMQVSSKRGMYFARSEDVIFRDSVVVLHPEFNLAADSMPYLATQRKVLFTGPTNIYTSASEIYTEGGYYDLSTEVAEFNRNPQYSGNNKIATADTIQYLSRQGEVMMNGNVSVTDADRKITGNSLRYLENTGETWIRGTPAQFTDSTRFISSPEIFYNEKTDQFSTIGRSEIRDGSQIIETDSSLYDKTKGLITFSGNVHWRDTIQAIGLKSENIDYSREREFMLAYGINRQLFYTIIENDTLYIAADTFNMWMAIDTQSMDSVRMMKAYHDVRLYKSDMQGLADSLVFHGRDSVFTFYKDPVLWSDTTQFSADSIYLTMKDKQLDHIILDKRALIVSEILDVYYDQIKGRNIIAHFDSSRIEDMLVTGNAESIYYTRDDDNAFIGVNKTICSKMFFTFDEGQIHLLKYYGDNSSTLYPMHEANHDQLRLEGFLWREEEKPNSVQDLLAR